MIYLFAVILINVCVEYALRTRQRICTSSAKKKIFRPRNYENAKPEPKTKIFTFGFWAI